MAQLPTMTSTDVAFRNNQDKLIRKNKCTFILRIHLYPLLTDNMCTTGVYDVPSSDTPNLNTFLTAHEANKCKGEDGLICAAVEPHARHIRVVVRLLDRRYALEAQWGEMIRRCELKMRAVVSLWGYYEDGQPRFVLRHDGYARDGEAFPPLTDFNVTHEPLQRNFSW